MYLIVIVAFMLVLPIGSILIEFAAGATDLVHIIGKWFVFWTGGLRLLTAGLSQIVRPAFTAQTIFKIQDEEAFKIVSELGFANVSMGAMSVLSIFFPAWIVPAALCTGLFYGLAGVGHALNTTRTNKENMAMLSDLFVFLVLGFVVVAGFATA
ncbi:DUF6790 family protein [Bradyrhizobium algeriense]|uniref:DUF6790 family protein n=1 Tax=Bradyrhizobium algeriense TaxID=634784 RepID=UPI000D3D105D|nr:DUF6790 family protein [Bradyrhizobium algeriense]